ncbi:SMP-30/gluconolactonase/LRE family protein [Aquimarina hainanensis]|uniref:SMP-30/gluconolactonase/LRE family protein n=1 Tax=Aquimarina hainanensis TaxID=1578017 RepID=A0ABW5N8I3_9FLAO|nr:hypothetical protein [Aquimarina sp. TRL1]QKX05419.1 hypothetical protein HN014_11000 [Aquimarina sp. TRL1]
MKFYLLTTYLLVISILFISCNDDNEPRVVQWDLVWEINDLPNPESVAFDKKRNVLYVSNQKLGGENGEASIGILSPNGTIIEKEWITGMDEPKGILIIDDKLYVSDKTVLIEIDIPSAEIINEYEGEGAQFLNDVAKDNTGNVYVSDMFTSAIYRLDKQGNFKLWLQDENLQNPNGLWIEDNYMYISAWGSFDDQNPLGASKGTVLKINMANKSFEQIGKDNIGHLDGIHPYNNGFLLSDWIEGKIFTFENGVTTKIIDTEQGSGDIVYLTENDIIIVPIAPTGKVLAFSPIKL